MKKDYQSWHKLKSDIEEYKTPPLFREREVWWSALGANIGTEEDGKNDLFERPIIVVRKFSKDLFWGVPATSQKKDNPFHFSFSLSGIERDAIVSQVRAISAKRLIRRIGKLTDPQFAELKIALGSLLANENENGPLAGSSGA